MLVFMSISLTKSKQSSIKWKKMSQGKTAVSLKSFYIFNGNYGAEEGEEEKKVLFYYPTETDIDTKIKDIGLCEAIIKFTSTFTQDNSCHTLRTEKTAQFYFQPETDFWMVMTLNVPKEQITKDGVECEAYHGEDVHNKVFRPILKQSYKMFRLFFGTFSDNLIGQSIDEQSLYLQDKLKQYFSKYLLNLKLTNCDILDTFQSIQNLQLSKLLFLRVHNLIEMIESTFPFINHMIFLYNDQLVWSEIDTENLYPIYEYLINSLLPNFHPKQAESGGISLQPNYSTDSMYNGFFVTGPIIPNEICVPVPKLNLFIVDKETKSTKKQVYYMIVYQAFNATICMFVEAENNYLNEEFFTELQVFIGPQLSTIGSDIGDSFTNIDTNSEVAECSTPKYMFFNSLTKTHQGTLQLNTRTKRSNIPMKVINIIADLYDENESEKRPETGETILKTMNDFWIVKRTSNWRHFYVIINKSSTLLEISEEANRLFELHLKDVFFETS